MQKHYLYCTGLPLNGLLYSTFNENAYSYSEKFEWCETVVS